MNSRFFPPPLSHRPVDALPFSASASTVLRPRLLTWARTQDLAFLPLAPAGRWVMPPHAVRAPARAPAADAADKSRVARCQRHLLARVWSWVTRLWKLPDDQSLVVLTLEQRVAMYETLCGHSRTTVGFYSMRCEKHPTQSGESPVRGAIAR